MRNPEYESYLSRSELAEFLRGLAEQVDRGNEIRVKFDEEEIKSEFTEPVQVEIEFEEEKGIKIKMKFKRRGKIRA